MNQTAIPEALNPQGESQAAPSADEVPSSFPEKYGDSSATKACDDTSKDEETTQRAIGRIDGVQYTELEDQAEAHEGQCVKSDEKERRP